MQSNLNLPSLEISWDKDNFSREDSASGESTEPEPSQMNCSSWAQPRTTDFLINLQTQNWAWLHHNPAEREASLDQQSLESVWMHELHGCFLKCPTECFLVGYIALSCPNLTDWYTTKLFLVFIPIYTPTYNAGMNVLIALNSWQHCHCPSV